MNYYEHHLGDYMRDTAHLSLLEDGTYRRLLDAYYIRERALPADLRECCKLARATTKAEREAVAYVLREFFTLTEDGHENKRAASEVARFKAKSDKARASVAKRWERIKNADADDAGTKNERSTNVSPEHIRTHNEGNTPRARPQSPVTSNQLSTKGTSLTARATRLPSDWSPGPDGLAFAAQHGFANGRAEEEAARFRDFWVAKAGQDGTKLDWQATWRNWVRRSAEHRTGRPGNQPPSPFEGVQ